MNGNALNGDAVNRNAMNDDAPDGETTLDVAALAESMSNAAREALAGKWPAIRSLAEMQFRALAGALAETGAMAARGEINGEHAREMVAIQQLSARSVLISVGGLTRIAAEQVLQAATRVAAAVVNRAVGIKLL